MRTRRSQKIINTSGTVPATKSMCVLFNTVGNSWGRDSNRDADAANSAKHVRQRCRAIRCTPTIPRAQACERPLRLPAGPRNQGQSTSRREVHPFRTPTRRETRPNHGIGYPKPGVRIQCVWTADHTNMKKRAAEARSGFGYERGTNQSRMMRYSIAGIALATVPLAHAGVILAGRGTSPSPP